MLTRVSSLSVRTGRKHIRLTYGTLSDWSVIQMAKSPKITNDKLFMAKIYEALVLATDFQIGSGAIIVNDGLVRIPNKVGDYAVKVEFVKN
jgi:hypothetical protein